MKFISIDVETTGVDPNTNKVIQIGACICDLSEPFDRTKTPTFFCNVKWSTAIPWDYQAVVMNSGIVEEMLKNKESEENLPPNEVTGEFKYWLSSNSIPVNKGFTVAGKNFSGFDLQFLNISIPHWRNEIRIKQRVIDIASHFWVFGDECLPTLQECLNRAGIERSVTHNALQDALDVAELVFFKLGKK